ncbi:Sec-independent protein translocase subunit TatA [Natronoglycomyces albus]|uniref:Sec-independent protein translocase protein TatA n=1 Tax=Natronoglycomyces albus TaxID=2811108 RepID=A0A895XYS1_9ACTN|nr:Sec-independent protein translocase subunit TatA [Natronoglycomyces albus]QSB06758.1 Sec-independent protein translocase subunit TatA [Natronoglycomyces albus]
MGAFKPWHIVVMILVVVLLFGSKKLPDMARGLGRSMRILKSETEAMRGEDKNDEDDGRAEPKHSRQPLDSQPADKTDSAVIEGESVKDDRKTY